MSSEVACSASSLKRSRCESVTLRRRNQQLSSVHFSRRSPRVEGRSDAGNLSRSAYVASALRRSAPPAAHVQLERRATCHTMRSRHDVAVAGACMGRAALQRETVGKPYKTENTRENRRFSSRMRTASDGAQEFASYALAQRWHPSDAVMFRRWMIVRHVVIQIPGGPIRFSVLAQELSRSADEITLPNHLAEQQCHHAWRDE